MLYLVSIHGRSKRIQQNAESADEAIRIIYDNLTEKLRNGALLQDCTAEELSDPMSQFKGRQSDAI